MRKQTKLVAVLSAAALLAIGASMTSMAATKGWQQEDDEWVYLDSDGGRVTEEWKKSGSEYYWLNEDGVMATDMLIKDEDDDIYYVDSTGRRVRNEWRSVDNEDNEDVNDKDVSILYYFFGSDGKAYRANDNQFWAKKTIDGKYYFFDEDGHMGSGWIMNYGDGSDYYYCGEETEGWAYTDKTNKDGWAYLEPDDAMTNPSGDEYDDQEWFNFKSSGKVRKANSGQQKTDYIKGVYYSFDENGVMLDDWYDRSVAAASGSTTVVATSAQPVASSNQTVQTYATESGVTGTGWVYVEENDDITGLDGDRRWFYLVTINVNGSKRSVPFNAGVDYLNYTGSAAKNDAFRAAGPRAKVIKSKTYLFDQYGRMYAGLTTNDDTGWIGDFATTGTVDYDSNSTTKETDRWNGITTTVLKPGVYYFDKTVSETNSKRGQMQTGKKTVEIDGDKEYFYFQKDGSAYTSIVKDGVVYGNDGKRIDADNGSSWDTYTTEYDIEYSKGTAGVSVINTDGSTRSVATGSTATAVKGIPAGTQIIISSSGKLKTSGSVKIDDYWYKIQADGYTAVPDDAKNNR